jgi:DNA-binding transcriptional ArsR family regulator
MADDVCDLLCLDLPRAEALRARRVDETAAKRLASQYRAFSDPTRLTLAFALDDGDELCVCDLAWILERAQNLVSHHLGSLRSEGLVEFRREGKMALYSLTPRGRELLHLMTLDRAYARG